MSIPRGEQEQAKKTNTSDLFSSIGALVGMVAGGGNPVSAALGGGLGSLLAGSTMSVAVNDGISSLMSAVTGGKPGLAYNLLFPRNQDQSGASFANRTGQDILTQLKQHRANNMMNMVPGMGGIGSLLGIMGGGVQGGNVLTSLLASAKENPHTLPLLLSAFKSNNPMGSLPTAQSATNETDPFYKGTPAPDFRYMAGGGMITGPGTGTSDSIPARIYQRGRPVQEARLSDGEFVMTERAVRGMGNGNRAKGAANMYRMMNQMEGRA